MLSKLEAAALCQGIRLQEGGGAAWHALSLTTTRLMKVGRTWPTHPSQRERSYLLPDRDRVRDAQRAGTLGSTEAPTGGDSEARNSPSLSPLEIIAVPGLNFKAYGPDGSDKHGRSVVRMGPPPPTGPVARGELG